MGVVLKVAEGVALSLITDAVTGVIKGNTIPEQCHKLFKKALDEWYKNRPNDIGLTRFED